jgi:hypothetical protein
VVRFKRVTCLFQCQTCFVRITGSHNSRRRSLLHTVTVHPSSTTAEQLSLLYLLPSGLLVKLCPQTSEPGGLHAYSGVLSFMIIYFCYERFSTPGGDLSVKIVIVRPLSATFSFQDSPFIHGLHSRSTRCHSSSPGESVLKMKSVHCSAVSSTTSPSARHVPRFAICLLLSHCSSRSITSVLIIRMLSSEIFNARSCDLRFCRDLKA